MKESLILKAVPWSPTKNYTAKHLILVFLTWHITNNKKFPDAQA